MFATRINSQQTARGTIDWREAQWKPRGESSDLKLEPVTLPRAVRSACRRLIRSLGLAYGAIDLIVTPQGEYVFLEVNPSGQFLWIDYEVGLPLLDAMSEMLIQGTPAYKWNFRAPRIRFDAGFLAATKDRERLSMSEHICDIQR
jgi:biotin carboxylase